MNTIDECLVLDIETMGVKRGAPILSIGACCGEKEYHAVVYPPTGEIEHETYEWWMSDKVTPAARREVLGDFEGHEMKPYSLRDALTGFVDFVRENNPRTFWGCAPDFDFGHVGFWLEELGIEVPWRFYQMRDIRTIKDFVPADVVVAIRSKYTPHIAIEDARAERDILQAFLNRQSMVIEPAAFDCVKRWREQKRGRTVKP